VPGYVFVAAENLLDSSHSGWSVDHSVIKPDDKGKLHVLLQHHFSGNRFVDYFVKSGNDWSVPLTLGKSYWSYSNSANRSLLGVTDASSVFAA